MRTVVGKPSTPTPIFSDVVEAVVFNPPWNVPTEIAAKEILPKLKTDPAYLEKNHYVILPGPGGAASHLQQKPGPDSALGLVKFDLPDPFDIYLHDTPAKAAFGTDSRALSHGCIRIQKPLDLARLLVAKDRDWGDDKIQETLAGGQTTRVGLAPTIPVSIGYWTVFVDDEGQLNFRPDLYRWDAKLMAMLAAGRRGGGPA